MQYLIELLQIVCVWYNNNDRNVIVTRGIPQKDRVTINRLHIVYYIYKVIINTLYGPYRGVIYSNTRGTPQINITIFFIIAYGQYSRDLSSILTRCCLFIPIIFCNGNSDACDES